MSPSRTRPRERDFGILPFPETLILPPRTITQRGAVGQLLTIGGEFGRRGVLVCGRSLEVSGRLQAILDRSPPELEVVVIPHAGGEPTLAQLDELRNAACRHHPDWFAAIGGGSVIDLAKAAAGLLHAPRPAIDYHDGMTPIDASKIPFLAVPTTAGTGSEATPVSVLTNQERCEKKSIRHPSFMPRVVILDPELLAGCPPRVIAAAGMDALTQALESFFSRNASGLTADWSIRAATLLDAALPGAFAFAQAPASDTIPAEYDTLLTGSFLAGLALANARLGLVHGLAHPLGARFHVAHGLACALCLPLVLEFNREAAAARYDHLAEVLHADPVERSRWLIDHLELSSPFDGQSLSDRGSIIRETLKSGSTAANPRPVDAADVDRILDALFV